MEPGATYSAQVVEVRVRGPVVEVADRGRRGLVDGFRFNARERRPFEVGDRLQVICRGDNGAGLASLCPAAEFVRPLIILDINGVLGAREAFNQKDPKRNRKFVVRPSALDFISFVSQLFEVAIWSCSTRQNLETDLRTLFADGGESLLCFVWDQDDSSNLWPRTSVVNSRKPLFLKELSRVWERYPCFGGRGTLLVDNHIEKFEKNPLGTCVLLPEWTPGSEDGALDPVRVLSSPLPPHFSRTASCGPTWPRWCGSGTPRPTSGTGRGSPRSSRRATPPRRRPLCQR